MWKSFWHPLIEYTKKRSYPCLPATPATAPVVLPLVLVPVPPRPVKVVDAVVLVAAVVFTALSPPKVPKLEPVPNPNPIVALEVDPSSDVVVVVAMLVLNGPLPRVRPVAELVPGVLPRVKPLL